MSFFYLCPGGCCRTYQSHLRLTNHLRDHPECAETAEQVERDKEIARKRAEEEEKEKARKIAEEEEKAKAQLAERNHAEAGSGATFDPDTSVASDSNNFPCIEDQDDDTAYPAHGGDDDGAEDDGEKDEDEEESSTSESDDDVDENAAALLEARVSVPFLINDSETETQDYDGTIMEKVSDDKWLVLFDDGEEHCYTLEKALEGVSKYKETRPGKSVDEEAPTIPGDDGAAAQEEAEVAPTDGKDYAVCKLIDDVRSTSDICGRPKCPMTMPNYVGARLISLLQKYNAPIALYPAVSQLLNEVKEKGFFLADGKVPTREATLKNLIGRYHLGGLRPKETQLQLPNAATKINVNTFSFHQLWHPS